MPLDDAPKNDDDVIVTSIGGAVADEPPPPLTGTWSSIGPGRIPDHGEGPPTIRPTDLATTTIARIGDNPSQERIPHAAPEKDLPVTEPTDATNDTNADATPPALREELRIGVRMLQALEAQFTRAESLIRREEDAATRAEDAITRLGRRLESIDTAVTSNIRSEGETIERSVDDAVTRINRVAEDVAGRLHERLERFTDLDTRLDEFDATLQTVERRITRIDPGTDTTRITRSDSAPAASSGSLTVEPRSGTTTPATTSSTAAESSPATTDSSDATIAALARLQLLIDRGEEVRRELRRDLEAICTASATLVEVVEQAAVTERTLRETLDQVGPETSVPVGDGDSDAWTVASILRRLADEFDAGLPPSMPTTPLSKATVRPMPASLASMRPIELDVSPGDGTPRRREPLEAAVDSESSPA